MNKLKFLSLIPALWTSLFDIVMTICGQPDEYWNGNLTKANEANPIGHFVMNNHVSGLFIISALWIIIIVLLGYYLPKKLSKVFLLFVFIAHSVGASSWILKVTFTGFLFFILFNAILYVVIEDTISKSN